MLYARGKRVKFTVHAQRRMSARRITDEQVIKVLEKPDTEGRARSKRVCEKYLNGTRMTQIRLIFAD